MSADSNDDHSLALPIATSNLIGIATSVELAVELTYWPHTKLLQYQMAMRGIKCIIGVLWLAVISARSQELDAETCRGLG